MKPELEGDENQKPETQKSRYSFPVNLFNMKGIFYLFIYLFTYIFLMLSPYIFFQLYSPPSETPPTPQNPTHPRLYFFLHFLRSYTTFVLVTRTLLKHFPMASKSGSQKVCTQME